MLSQLLSFFCCCLGLGLTFALFSPPTMLLLLQMGGPKGYGRLQGVSCGCLGGSGVASSGCNGCRRSFSHQQHPILRSSPLTEWSIRGRRMLLAASYSNNNGFDEGDRGSRVVVSSCGGAGKHRGGHIVGRVVAVFLLP